jgi:AAA15 family ATPase/GTPase
MRLGSIISPRTRNALSRTTSTSSDTANGRHPKLSLPGSVPKPESSGMRPEEPTLFRIRLVGSRNPRTKMHIKSLEIRNFRAIEIARLDDLPSTIVIAGPNGCGKSCIFDALRLWKSVIGGYNENEWHHWFSEFQISLGLSDKLQLERIFRDRTKPVHITADVALAPTEITFLKENAVNLLRPLMERLTPAESQYQGPARRGPTTAVATTQEGIAINDRIALRARQIIHELESATTFTGTFTINPDLSLQRNSGPTLEFLYSLYIPEFLGVFEYHSAQRIYQREQISNVNLQIENVEQQQSQHALYNWAAKYQNVKTQLASNYVRELLAERAGVVIPKRESLIESMKELFRLFFPDKEFLGAQPTVTGALTFNVKTSAGKEHDINELSSGEKEVLYGYLRLRNLSPRHSVLLLDEPEMHLNPRLIKGLPQFYHQYLGETLSNQIWLLTHSDTLLKEALDQEGFALYHMLPPSADMTGNQLVPIASGETLDRAILDLVGEVASYRPDGKLVIFEGGGDTDFDVGMTSDLFPELLPIANMISGSNKTRVRELHRLLEKARNKGALGLKVFSVVDRDSGPVEGINGPSRELMWDCYHIENYLLEPKYLLGVLKDALREKNSLETEDALEVALHSVAKDVAETVVREELGRSVNSTLVRCIEIGCDPEPGKILSTLQRSILRSRDRLGEAVAQQLSETALRAALEMARTRVSGELAAGKWKKTLPGRDILRRFSDRHAAGMGYERLRNLTIAAMRRDGFRPPGMASVIEEIMKG